MSDDRTLNWSDVGIRSSVGDCGIRMVDDHWLYWDDAGDYPGKFEDREAARWGCWVTEEDAQRINGVERRLITHDDVRACMRAHMAEFEALKLA